MQTKRHKPSPIGGKPYVQNSPSIQDSALQSTERTLINGTLAPNNLSATEIIFIDAIVDGLEQHLVANPEADIVLIDSSADGLTQIAKVLNGRNNIKSIDIICNGESGKLQLGNSSINITALNQTYSAQLATIKSALKDSADLLLYGCKIGEGKRGANYIDRLANITAANVAASIQLTGHASLGGDWDLKKNKTLSKRKLFNYV